MSVTYAQILFSTFFGITSLYSPIGDSYTLTLPSHIDLTDTSSFNVGINAPLSEAETLNVEFANSFCLSDSHGKDDVYGSVINNELSFSSQDNDDKTVYLQIDNPGVGEWNGSLDLTITYTSKAQSNILIDGPSINEILKSLNPTTISFKHDYTGDYLYDISTAQDGSIVVYSNGTEAVIANSTSDPIKANADMSNLFMSLNMTKINNLNFVDFSECENMSSMFRMCGKITSNIDVSSMDTSSCKNMSHMFDGCSKLRRLTGIENFDVSNVEDLSYLLNGMKALTAVPDLTNWNISNKCKDISYMMASVAYTEGRNGQSKWPTTEVDYTGWDVSSVTNMAGTFKNAFMLTTLNLTGWNTGNVTDMSEMFKMYDNTERSRLVTIKGIENFDVSNVENMDSMFYDCLNLANIDFSLWQPINIKSLNMAFYGTKKLNLRVFENWANVVNLSNVDTTDCFAGGAGESVDTTYKVPWYN